jgi:hypothetical protein
MKHYKNKQKMELEIPTPLKPELNPMVHDLINYNHCQSDAKET